MCTENNVRAINVNNNPINKKDRIERAKYILSRFILLIRSFTQTRILMIKAECYCMYS